MAIVIESFTSNVTALFTPGTLVLTKPASVATGDLLLLIVGHEFDGGTAYTTKAGWVLRYEEGAGSPEANAKIGLYTRIADGTEPASETVDWTTFTGEAGGGWYLRISGNHPTNFFDVLGSSSQSTSTSSQAAPAITPTVNDCLVFSHHSFDGADGTISVSGTNWPSTIPAAQNIKSAGSSSFDWSGAWITQTQTTAATSNDCVWAHTSSDGMVQIQFSIAPAALDTILPFITKYYMEIN